MKAINVLSLFDGISCGQIALERARIPVKNYFASEIDKHAIKVTQHNYPNTIQLGDVTKWKEWDLPKIDLLIGGSPCQDLSVANKSGEGLSGKKSSLFWYYLDIMRNYNPIYFLLENVKMSRLNKETIDRELETEGILINSALLSAQKRNRYYWTNIHISEIKDKGILVKNVLDQNPSEALYLSDEEIEQIAYKKSKKKLPRGKQEGAIEFPQSLDRKSLCLIASDTSRSRNRTTNVIFDGKGIRRFSPEEYEKLQTIPMGYTSMISSNQRYKSIGNAWTVDVVSHIFNGINQ